MGEWEENRIGLKPGELSRMNKEQFVLRYRDFITRRGGRIDAEINSWAVDTYQEMKAAEREPDFGRKQFERLPKQTYTPRRGRPLGSRNSPRLT
jgi:hypothetical protein